eukprot:gene8012-biopygen3602
MFCIGNTKDIDVKLYGQIEESSFEGRGEEFLGSLYLLIWVYIGLEIVPQTCPQKPSSGFGARDNADVASLARSGLLPSVFAKTYGENETPVVALGVSTLVQFLIGMKRHWVSPVGIPGALVGMGMAVILCIAVIVLNPYNKATATYFVFMGGATLYYVLYARHTQYFSKEEQQHFLKAYILNANKAKSKQKTLQQKVMEAIWSGKAMTMTESKKFLEVLMSAPEDVANQLVESLPNQFVSLCVDEAAIASVVMDAMGAEGKRGDESEDREVLLGEIVEGALEDGEGV